MQTGSNGPGGSEAFDSGGQSVRSFVSEVSENKGHAVNVGRREFLKLGGIGLAGLTLAGGSLVGASEANAQESPAAESAGPLRREFEAAAGEYGVPVETLLAMGYVNTRWEMPDSGVNAYEEGEAPGRGTYGIMALVQNPSTDTLGEAASLSGIPEEQLKTNRASNIRGGAALLAEASGVDLTGISSATDDFSDTMSRAADDLDATDPRSVERFTNTVTGAVDSLTQSIDAVREGLSGGMAVAGVGGGELYAGQVRDVLRSGVSETISTGERVSLAPAEV